MDIFVGSLKISHYIVLCLVSSLQADVIEYHTPKRSGPPNYMLKNLYADGIRIARSTSIIFQLKSRAFSYILLQENQTDYTNNVVEIVLGRFRNEAATISDIPNIGWKSIYHENGILSQSQYQYFWISWTTSTVRVGKGNTPNKQEFMNWQHLTSDIKYISIGTGYWTDGYWKFTIESKTSTSTPVTVSMTTNESLISTVEKQQSSLVAVYVSVTGFVAIFITGVIIVFVLRRRKRNMRQQESEVYSGNKPKNDKKPICIIVNREYDNHSLEKENHNGYSNDSFECISPDIHYIDISLREEPLTEAIKYDYSTVNKKAKHTAAYGHSPEHDEFNYTKVNPRSRCNVENDYGYNHVNTNQQQKNNPQNYSTLAMGINGQKADGTDMMYSHIGIRGNKGHKAGVEAENTYNKLNLRQNQNELFDENDKAVYDHAGSDVRYPDMNETDDYSHLN